MAFAAARGIPVLAISDETAGTVSGYLNKRREAFFEVVAVDPVRRSFIDYGVSGTPTIVLVDDKGVVRHSQVGYKAGDGLTVEGWRWAPGSEVQVSGFRGSGFRGLGHRAPRYDPTGWIQRL